MRKIEQERVAARVCYGGGSRVAAGVCCGGGSRQERCCCTQEELPHDLFFKIFGGEAIYTVYITPLPVPSLPVLPSVHLAVLSLLVSSFQSFSLPCSQSRVYYFHRLKCWSHSLVHRAAVECAQLFFHPPLLWGGR